MTPTPAPTFHDPGPRSDQARATAHGSALREVQDSAAPPEVALQLGPLNVSTVGRPCGRLLGAFQVDGVYARTLAGPTLTRDFLRLIDDYAAAMPGA